MPRKTRIDAPGAVQHIIIRGIERKAIFRDTADKDTFVERFGKIVIQTSTPCYAWVLMDMLSILIVVINVMANCSRIGIDLFYATKMNIYLSWFDIYI
jgi:hypothetical protein